MSLFNAQVYFVVMEQFPLVEEMVDGLELLSIRNNRWIKALIDVSLSDGNVVFKINNAVLVNIVIHFVVHTLHHMVSDKVVGIG